MIPICQTDLACDTNINKYLHNDVIDWDMDQLDKESNKTHDSESNSCGHCNLLEFCKKNTL